MTIKCPKCCSGLNIKNGYVRNKQRYRCSQCRCNYTLGDNRNKHDNKIRKLAIRMYLNNCGFRRIAEILEVPLSTVFSWIKKAGQIVDELLLYAIHGLLHCCGFNDDTPEATSKMRDQERLILHALGRGDVYAQGGLTS